MAQIVHLPQTLPAQYALGVALLAVMLTFSYVEDVLFDCMLSLHALAIDVLGLFDWLCGVDAVPTFQKSKRNN